MALTKQQAFRLRPTLLAWKKQYHAPFVGQIFFGLLKHFKRHYPTINWDNEIIRCRNNIARTKRLGLINCKDRAIRVRVKEHFFEFSPAFAGWALIYPDYLLNTYPLTPAGNAKTLDPNWKMSCNPYHHYPSKYWHLPPEVYTFFELEYGKRNSENVKAANNTRFIEARDKYAEYFCWKFNLPRNYFLAFNSTKTQKEIVGIKEVFNFE